MDHHGPWSIPSSLTTFPHSVTPRGDAMTGTGGKVPICCPICRRPRPSRFLVSHGKFFVKWRRILGHAYILYAYTLILYVGYFCYLLRHWIKLFGVAARCQVHVWTWVKNLRNAWEHPGLAELLTRITAGLRPCVEQFETVNWSEEMNSWSVSRD